MEAVDGGGWWLEMGFSKFFRGLPRRLTAARRGQSRGVAGKIWELGRW